MLLEALKKIKQGLRIRAACGIKNYGAPGTNLAETSRSQGSQLALLERRDAARLREYRAHTARAQLACGSEASLADCAHE